MNLVKIKKYIRDLFRDMQAVNRSRATELLDFEVMEMENIFSLLLFGSFTGMPSPPAHITLQLLPLMQDELKIMFNRISVAHDALAEVVSILGEP